MSPEVAVELHQHGLNPSLGIALPILFVAITAIAVALRGYVRAFMIKSVGWDDWLLLAAFAMFITDAALYTKIAALELEHGLVANLEKLSGYILATVICYLASQVLLKVSMAIYFLRIVKDKSHRLIIYCSVGFYSVFSVAFIFIVLFQCGPPTAINFTKNQCLSWEHVMAPLNYTAGGLNAIVDWIFIATPLMVVLNTMMPMRAKISVILLILLGSIGSVFSVARIPLLSRLEVISSLSYYSRIVPIGFLSLGETAMGISAISLASIRPLVSRCIERQRSEHSLVSNKIRATTTVQLGVANKSGWEATVNGRGDDGLNSDNKIPLATIEQHRHSQENLIRDSASDKESV